jgi:hypothetical protein
MVVDMGPVGGEGSGRASGMMRMLDDIFVFEI